MWYLLNSDRSSLKRNILDAFRIVAKSAYYLHNASPFAFSSVRLSAYISMAPTGRISVKFDIGDSDENL